ncbi:MAG: hypothetical protein H7174_00320 [Flavobacterium sp.]|nr:hypothetical protein [Flavobacterium sp.]
MPHPKTNRTFKHIWFSDHTNPTHKNQKSLNFPTLEKIRQKDLTIGNNLLLLSNIDKLKNTSL